MNLRTTVDVFKRPIEVSRAVEFRPAGHATTKDTKSTKVGSLENINVRFLRVLRDLRGEMKNFGRARMNATVSRAKRLLDTSRI